MHILLLLFVFVHFSHLEAYVSILMPLDAIGIAQPLSSNILEFLKALPGCASEKGITFSTPSEIISKSKSISPIEVLYPISWLDEERDISACDSSSFS